MNHVPAGVRGNYNKRKRGRLFVHRPEHEAELTTLV